MLDSVSQDQDYAARVAAQVAARYGVTVPVGAVQCVPTGVSGLPQPVWDGRNLVYVEAQTGWRKKPGASSPKRQGLVDPAVQDRRARVAEMHATGASDYQMADAFGVDVRVIRIDRKVMRLAANAVRHKGPSTQSEIRIGRIRSMMAEGKSTAEMMEMLGLSRDAIRHLARQAGITLTSLPRKDSARLQERAETIATMIATGSSRAEILAAVGIGAAQARRLAARVGLVLPEWQRPASKAPAPRKSRAIAGGPHQQRDQRHACLRWLNISGMDLAQIAAAVAKEIGRAVSVKTTRADLRALGLKPGDLRHESRARRPDVAVRSKRLAEMRGMDMTHVTVAQLVAMFGVSEPQVRRDLAEVGKVASSRSAADDRIEATRARIKAMVAEGCSRKEIMAGLGIKGWATMKGHLDALGIDLPRGDKKRMVHGACTAEQGAALRLRIAEMRRAGLTIRQIGEAVNRSVGTVSHHIRVLEMVGSSRSAGQRAA